MLSERISRDQVFKEMTDALAKRSVCKRSQVAAIIVKNGRPISVGYNGPPSGHPHCVECLGEACNISIHAEMNAIAFAAKEGVAIEGCTLYCSMSPCINCAKVIINSGIKEVVYFEEYRLRDGINLLEKFVEVRRYPKYSGHDDSFDAAFFTMENLVDQRRKKFIEKETAKIREGVTSAAKMLEERKRLIDRIKESRRETQSNCDAPLPPSLATQPITIIEESPMLGAKCISCGQLVGGRCYNQGIIDNQVVIGVCWLDERLGDWRSID